MMFLWKTIPREGKSKARSEDKRALLAFEKK
jgi:hypothetical protein